MERAQSIRVGGTENCKAKHADATEGADDTQGSLGWRFCRRDLPSMNDAIGSIRKSVGCPEYDR